jgi:hypothetical protein
MSSTEAFSKRIYVDWESGKIKKVELEIASRSKFVEHAKKAAGVSF